MHSQEPAQPAKPAKREAEPKFELKPGARLRVQRLKTRKARALYEVARLNRELAEIAVEEYIEGTFPLDLARVEAEIKAAEADLARARSSADRARRMFDRGQLSGAEWQVAEHLPRVCQFALEQAQSKKYVLVKYTRERTIKNLESEVKKARKLEGDKEAARKLEAAKLADLEREVGRK